MGLHVAHQGLSGWDRLIHRDAPTAIHDLCQGLAQGRLHAHYFALPTRTPDGVLSATTVAAAARWAGLLRRAEWTDAGHLKISGPGLAALIGDEDNKGDGPTAAFTQNKAFWNGASASWLLDHVAPGLNGLTFGTVGTHTSTYNIEIPFGWSRRQILDTACEVAGREWRINPTGTIDANTPALLCADGQVIVGPVTGDRDGTLVGINARLGVAHDGKDTTERVRVNDSASGDPTGSATYSGWPFVGWDGTASRWRRAIQASEMKNDTAAGNLATQQLARFDQVDVELTVRTDHPDVLGHLREGDRIGAWDPQKGIYDLTNPVAYRGEIIAPKKVRVLKIDANVPEGFGEQLRWWDGSAFQVTDLSQYMIPEEPGATLEVDRLQQTLLRS